MDYEELVTEIKKQGVTKLPALLVIIVEQCIEKKVFVKGGMLKIINRILEKREDVE